MFTAQHRLEIEYMRWLRIPAQLRFCKHCTSLGKQVVGDEWHNIAECPLFDEARCVVLTKYADVLNQFWENRLALDMQHTVFDANNLLLHFEWLRLIQGSKFDMNKMGQSHLAAILGKSFQYILSVKQAAFDKLNIDFSALGDARDFGDTQTRGTQ